MRPTIRRTGSAGLGSSPEWRAGFGAEWRAGGSGRGVPGRGGRRKGGEDEKEAGIKRLHTENTKPKPSILKPSTKTLDTHAHTYIHTHSNTQLAHKEQAQRN